MASAQFLADERPLPIVKRGVLLSANWCYSGWRREGGNGGQGGERVTRFLAALVLARHHHRTIIVVGAGVASADPSRPPECSLVPDRNPSRQLQESPTYTTDRR